MTRRIFQIADPSRFELYGRIIQISVTRHNGAFEIKAYLVYPGNYGSYYKAVGKPGLTMPADYKQYAADIVRETKAIIMTDIIET